MAFSESLKSRVKQRSHFSCCLCKDIYVEVHHIVPQEEGGPDDEDNAAPLCPSCHERYGGNATKRKFIREARDHWYEICDERYKGVDTAKLAAIDSRLDEVATKQDVQDAFRLAVELIQARLTAPGIGVAQAKHIVAHVSASAVSSAAMIPAFGDGLGPSVLSKGTPAESKTPVLPRRPEDT